jgi:hypothetical protein
MAEQVTKAAWRNGIASDYDKVGDQEIAGSTPAVVIFPVFNKKLLILAQFTVHLSSSHVEYTTSARCERSDPDGQSILKEQSQRCLPSMSRL